jgi:cytochrome c oxidase assembly factor CtaG/cytochrome c2
MPVISDAVVFALMHPAAVDTARVTQASTAWTFEPGVVGPLAIAAVLYAAGVARLWRAAGRSAGIRAGHVACFASGCAALVAALVSPIGAASGELSSAHMVQHELLMIVAAPLLVGGLPLLAFLFVLPHRWRKGATRAMRVPWVSATTSMLMAPAFVWLLHAAAIWIWHVPVLYELALQSDTWHAVEHGCFFITASLFWWGLARGRYGRMGYGAAVVYVFATALHTGLLGAAMTVSPSIWYPAYLGTTARWGMTPLEDQQLAGLIMWVPAGLVFTAIGLMFFAAWLRESERRSRFSRVASTAVLLVAATLVLNGCGRDVWAEASAMTGGDPTRGRDAIDRYGCGTCHTIPGVRTARGKVGPSLEGVASRVYLAGHLPNTPVGMQDWIQRPHAHDPQTVMPETGITPEDARDVAAYLYTLR